MPNRADPVALQLASRRPMCVCKLRAR
jgi:hypothetical protein